MFYHSKGIASTLFLVKNHKYCVFQPRANSFCTPAPSMHTPAFPCACASAPVRFLPPGRALHPEAVEIEIVRSLDRRPRRLDGCILDKRAVVSRELAKHMSFADSLSQPRALALHAVVQVGVSSPPVWNLRLSSRTNSCVLPHVLHLAFAQWATGSGVDEMGVGIYPIIIKSVNSLQLLQ